MNAHSSVQTPFNPTAPFDAAAFAGYLAASSGTKQPLCGNAEGWGPLSPVRYDFTPCFLDVWISTVSVFVGIVGGGAAAWYLHRQSKQEVGKNWHFWTKMGVMGGLLASLALQAALQIEYYKGIWFGDFRFWTTIVNIVSVAIILYVQYIEHTRSRNPNGVVLFFWLLLLIAYAVKLRSLLSQQIHKDHVAYFATFCVSVGLAALEFVLEWLVPKKQSAYDALGDEYECPYNYADVFSVLTFGWMTPMMRYGYKHFLTQDDLWNLRKQDSTRDTSEAFDEAWEIQLQRKNPSLSIALVRAFGGPYFQGALFKIVSDVLQFVQPQLLRLLIQFVYSYKTSEPEPVIRGAAIALGMFAVSVAQTACLHQYFQRAFETGMRVKSALTNTIYGKAMRLSNEGRATKSTGDIVNYMAVDTQRLSDLTQFLQQLWSAPFQIILCLASLYQLLGYSFVAGIGVMILMIPVNGLIARFLKRYQKVQMKNKDARTRLTTEILNNMKAIKLYAWGSAFMNKLSYIRNDQELVTLRKIGAVQALATFTWSTTPFLVSCSTFAVFVLTQDKPLSTDIVFPGLTLFNLITFPLAVLPMLITSIIEATVAIGRLTDYLTAEELQDDAVKREAPVTENGEETIRIRDATFTWQREEGKNNLHNINFTAHKGDLTCIVGRVGAGKSSMLAAMLGDMYKMTGEVVVRGTTAYVAQSPWIMNASVKENIIFGHRLDPQFYEATVKACALVDDFKSLPDGDQTEVGERGISLSGGQKARVTLARAVYTRADVYLFDDVLSAVDQHVGRHIINSVLGPNGLLAGKTRVLATNSIPVLMEASYVNLLRDGRIIEKGTYAQLIAMKGEIANLVRTANNETESRDAEEREIDDLSPSSEVTVYGTGDSSEVEEIDQIEPEEAEEGQDMLAPIRTTAPRTAERKQSNLTLRRASTVSFRGPRGKVTDEEAEGNLKSKQTKEFSEQGKVKWKVYAEYAKTSHLGAVAIYLMLLLAAQTAQIGMLSPSPDSVSFVAKVVQQTCRTTCVQSQIRDGRAQRGACA